MADKFELKHIRIEAFAEARDYQRPNSGGAKRDYGRETERHAEALKRGIAEAFAEAGTLLASRSAETEGDPGAYVGFKTAVDSPLPSLEWAREGIRLATADRSEDGSIAASIFVPDRSREHLEKKLSEYGTNRTAKGNPRHAPRFDPVDQFFAVRLENLWVDTRALPDGNDPIWWEVWCWPDRVQNLVARAEALNLLVSEDRLTFPERVVVYVYGSKSNISVAVASCDAVAEIRRGRDSAAFFSGLGIADQNSWVDEAFGRLEFDARADVALCILDTGVNRAHPLLEASLSEDDLYSVKNAWGLSDDDGHGSEMAGLSLFGDLTTTFQSQGGIELRFPLESVKILPPAGFDATEPGNFGLITLQAISRPEIAKPQRKRIFCLAVSQSEVHGPRASSWSAALDSAAWQEGSEEKSRLVCVAAGNLPDTVGLNDLEDWEEHEVEDPGQSWNSLTIGGFTEKSEVGDTGYEHWLTAATAGALSPYSRISSAWRRGVSPIKPELVLEAGNRGIDPVGSGLSSGMPSLSLLTTSADPIQLPLTLSWATSAATAQGAGMAAAIWADSTELWPETVRALLVHSARWTPWMSDKLLTTQNKGVRLHWLRHFGYGVPSLERALRSRSNALALVSERTIQPFIRPEGIAYARLNVADFYNLPWPSEALRQLGAAEVRVRATLSYFVDPNPSADAPLSPARYRSAGLRFALQKRNETANQFATRINALAEAEDELIEIDEADDARVLGERSISAGSLHVDEWRCQAVDLAERKSLAVFPVGGWWKTVRAKEGGQMRYALVVTIDAGDAEVDLYAEVSVAAGIAIEV